MTQMRQLLSGRSRIPPGGVVDRGAGLGWDMLDEGGSLADEGIVFGGRATELEKEGIALGRTVDCVGLGKKLTRKAWVR